MIRKLMALTLAFVMMLSVVGAFVPVYATQNDEEFGEEEEERTFYFMSGEYGTSYQIEAVYNGSTVWINAGTFSVNDGAAEVYATDSSGRSCWVRNANIYTSTPSNPYTKVCEVRSHYANWGAFWRASTQDNAQ